MAKIHVALLVSAWIEIADHVQRYVNDLAVALLVSAWIEISLLSLRI